MPSKTSDETIETIVKMIRAGIADRQIAEVVGMTRTGVTNIRDRFNRGTLYATPMGRPSNADIGAAVVHGTEAMAAKFARAMNGQRFESIRTKCYGRALPPNPSHVMTQSSAGSCADVA